MTLAVDSYRHVGTLADAANVLNLAWTVDEREFLSIDVHALIERCLEKEIATHLAWTGQYFVKDPYGAGALGPAVEALFGVAGLAPNICCGAGVSALLHALAQGWAPHSVVLAAGIYPDFPHWLQRSGASIVALPADAQLQQWQSHLASAACSLVYIERPAFADGRWDDIAPLRELCWYAARVGASVLIDESNANYCHPSYSAVPLTLAVDNLAVLRGFSKAYGLGGIRMGLCISSAALTPRVRAAIPPLQAAALSLLVARTLLEAGDIAAPLRQRIALMKPRALGLLCAAGRGAAPCNEFLPYIILPNACDLARAPAGGEVATKQHPLWTGPGELAWVRRCSVPLREARMGLLESLLAPHPQP